MFNMCFTDEQVISYREKAYDKFRIINQGLIFLLIFSLLLTQFASTFVTSVYAASSPWSQADWSGGSGQTSWSDTTKFGSSSNVTTSTANQVTLVVTSGWCSNTYCNSSWGYRKKITFNNTDANLGVTSENLVNFPVLVKLSSSNIDYTKTQDSGQDIRFTDTDGSDLAYEIEKWDETGTSFVWVKVPQIDINSSTDYIYLYYGNTSATDHQQASTVWSNSYVGVWHLKESGNGIAGEYIDSTSINNGQGGGGTANAVPTATSSGQLDGAQMFDGTYDYIDVGSGDSIKINESGWTVAAWIYPLAAENTANGTRSAIYYAGTGATWWIIVYGNDILFQKLESPWNSVSVNINNIQNSNWYQVVVTSIGATKNIYVNGNLIKTGPLSVNNATGGKIGLGFTDHFKGTIDETRVSNSTRSAAWIAASYKSESNAFNTFVAEEQVYSVGSGTLTSSIYDSGQRSNWGTLTYAETVPSNTSVSVKVRTGSQSDLSDATAFSSCSAISSSSDISSNSCVTDTNRYIQYQLSLANTDSISTPTFTSFSQAFSLSTSTAPSSFSGTTAGTTSITWSWTDNSTDEDGFYVQDTSGNTKCSVLAANTTSCSEASLSPNSSYTRKIVSYNGSGNSIASSNASATTRAVPSPSLESPGDNSYTTGDRPSFKFKTPTDNTSTRLYSDVSSYRLYIKNDEKEIFCIFGIPSFRTSDYDLDPKYVAQYDGFSDSDITNNYITVYTRSTSNWGSSENDGKLISGKNTWGVGSRDGSNNEADTERTIYYDTTAPTISLDKLGSFSFDSKYSNWYFTSLKPTLSGKSSEQGTVNIIFNKKGFNTGILGGYGNFITANVNTDSNGNFSWTPELEYGDYKVTIKAKDQAGNTSPEIKFNLTVYTYDNLVEKGIIKTAPAKFISEESKPTSEVSTAPQPTITIQPKEGGPIIPPEPNVIQKVGTGIVKTSQNIFNGTVNLIGGIFNGVGKVSVSIAQGVEHGAKVAFNTISSGLAFTGEKIGNGIAFAFNITGKGLAFVEQGIQAGFSVTGHGLALAGEKTGQTLSFVGSQIGKGVSNVASATGSGLAFTSSAIAQGYNNLADNAPGVAKTILIGIRDGVTIVGKGVADTTGVIASTTTNATKATGSIIGNVSGATATATVNTAKSVSQAVADTTTGITKATTQFATNTAWVTSKTITSIAQATTYTTGKAVNDTKKGISQLAFNVGQRTEDVSDTLGFAIVKLGYLFVNEPTTISDVKVAKLNLTTAKITWNTNHPATSKVNYGLTQDFGQDIQNQKRVTQHEIIITGLKPKTQYYYEVMSQNSNYVFDANHTFITSDDKM